MQRRRAEPALVCAASVTRLSGEGDHNASTYSAAGACRRAGDGHRLAGRGPGSGLRSVHRAELPWGGADGPRGDRVRPRRPRRHHGGVRPLPGGRRPREPAGDQRRGRHVRPTTRASLRDRRRARQRHAQGPRARARRRGEADGPGHLGLRGRVDRAREPRDPLDRRQRARRRGERHRRGAAHALRARGPRRLRRPADPRHVARRDPPDAEPGRPRGRHAPELLRLRHEPRLVRAHAARDGRQGRAAAPLSGRDVHRRARDGQPGRLLLPAQRGPDLPRDHRPVRPLDQRGLRRGDAGRVRRPRHPVLQLQHLRPLLHGLRRHRALDGVRCGGHDVREDEHAPDAAARVRAVPDAVDLALGGGDQQARDPHGLARGMGRGRAPGPRGRAGAQRDRPAGERRPAARARQDGAPLLRARRRPVQGA